MLRCVAQLRSQIVRHSWQSAAGQCSTRLPLQFHTGGKGGKKAATPKPSTPKPVTPKGGKKGVAEPEPAALLERGVLRMVVGLPATVTARDWLRQGGLQGRGVAWVPVAHASNLNLNVNV